MFWKRCQHDWTVFSKDVLPPIIKKVEEIRGTVPYWMVQSKIIILYGCKKCGKLKKIVETNPDIGKY
jgi:hypothetical protein